MLANSQPSILEEMQQLHENQLHEDKAETKVNTPPSSGDTEKSSHAAVTNKPNLDNAIKTTSHPPSSTRALAELDWKKLTETGKGWEHMAAPHFKRRQADIAGSLPKTSPDVIFSGDTEEVRYIDPLGPYRGYPNLVNRSVVCICMYI
jgi:hypothetical protein